MAVATIVEKMTRELILNRKEKSQEQMEDSYRPVVEFLKAFGTYYSDKLQWTSELVVALIGGFYRCTIALLLRVFFFLKSEYGCNLTPSYSPFLTDASWIKIWRPVSAMGPDLRDKTARNPGSFEERRYQKPKPSSKPCLSALRFW